MPDTHASRREASDPSVPLCVDLDDGVVIGDLAVERALAQAKGRPGYLLGLPFRLALGRYTESGRGRRRGLRLDPALLPYNHALLALLEDEKAAGRTIVLVANGTAEHADSIAQHLGLFDEVLCHGANGGKESTASALERRFGPGGFEYLGTEKRLSGLPDGAGRTRVAPPAHPRPDLGVILQALRAHQWLKNALVFLPVLAGQRFTEIDVLGRATVAFIVFSLAASSVYVVNDLLDLQEDRLHATKRFRPFASGRLPVRWAPPLLAALIVPAVLASALLLPPAFTGWLGVYLFLTLAYSVRLKGVVLIDVFTLAALYTLRVIAGSAATGIDPSVWLLGFCMFFFLSLALVKRYAELHAMGPSETVSRVPGRSYDRRDLPVLVALGVGSGCMSVLVLALYVISDEFARHYSHPVLIWQLCPLTLYWIGRAWMVVSRDEMHDDPLVWAVKDHLSRLVAIAAVVLLLLAR